MVTVECKYKNGMHKLLCIYYGGKGTIILTFQYNDTHRYIDSWNNQNRICKIALFLLYQLLDPIVLEKLD